MRDQPGGRWLRFGTSIFTTMTQAANRVQAVNLAQGFPNFDGPEAIKDAAIAAIRGHSNQYAPAPGLLGLRQALAARQQNRSGMSYDAEREVTVFSGATEALFCAIVALCEPGDELITFEPFYDSYPVAAFTAGAKIRPVPLVAPRWDFDPRALEAAITPRTKAILVNTPHNPTGRVFTRAEMDMIAGLARKHDLIVITDEVYEELVFEPATHNFMASLPGMRERTVVISSTSKTYSMTGWKVGFAFAPEALTQALRALHQFTVFCSATPLQAGMIAALQLGDDYYTALRTDYRRRRDVLLKSLSAAGFRCSQPEGTYFILADYSALSNLDDQAFALWLTETAKVASIPVSAFYQDPAAASQKQRYVRFAFCKDEATLQQAGKNLQDLPH